MKPITIFKFCEVLLAVGILGLPLERHYGAHILFSSLLHHPARSVTGRGKVACGVRWTSERQAEGRGRDGIGSIQARGGGRLTIGGLRYVHAFLAILTPHLQTSITYQCH